jgi:hypothetical protein
MKLDVRKTWLILVETSFLIALSLPILKVHLATTVLSISFIYAYLYSVILLGITHLVPFRKRKSEYISGLAIFMFYLLHLTLSGNTVAPSSFLMLVICFGKPFWLFQRHSIIIFILINIVLMVTIFISISNIIILLASISISSQNYVSALIFAMTYLVFYLTRSKINGAAIGLGLGSTVLFAFRSRTSIIALLPIYLKLIKKSRPEIKIVIIGLCLAVLTSTNFLDSLLFKYSD